MKKMKIAIVEDDKEIADKISKVLIDADFDVEIVDAKSEHDLLVSDIHDVSKRNAFTTENDLFKHSQNIIEHHKQYQSKKNRRNKP